MAPALLSPSPSLFLSMSTSVMSLKLVVQAVGLAMIVLTTTGAKDLNSIPRQGNKGESDAMICFDAKK